MSPPPHPPRHAWLFCLAPALVSACSRGLWAPDEPRYAQVAREIFERGDFLVMHLCSEVYPDKPPLLFWLAGLLGALSDWSVPAMRLVSVLATGFTAWCVARLARRWWGEAEARWAPVLFLTSAMVLEIGGRLQIDPLLTALCTGALLLLDDAAQPSLRRRWSAAGALVGLAALAKGPVAFVDVGLVLAAWVALRPSYRRSLRPGVWLPALAFAVVPVAAWALAAAAREPELGRELFYGQHVDRIIDTRGRHPGPPWKHLLRMPLFLLPWTVPVAAQLVSLTGTWRRRRDGRERFGDDGVLRAGAWLLVLFVFFSVIRPKRDLYLLPAYPAAALLAARWITSGAGMRAAAGWTAAGTALLAGGLLLAAPFLPHEPFALLDLGLRPWPAGAVLLAGGAVVAARLRTRRPWELPLVAAWVAGLTLAFAAVLPAIDPHKSAEVLADRVARLPHAPRTIPCIGVRPEGYRFYGDLPTVRAADLSEALERDGPDFLALVSEAALAELPEDVRARTTRLLRQEVGSKDVVVLGAAPR